MKIKRIQRGGEFSNVYKGVDSEKIDWLLIKIKDKKRKITLKEYEIQHCIYFSCRTIIYIRNNSWIKYKIYLLSELKH